MWRCITARAYFGSMGTIWCSLDKVISFLCLVGEMFWYLTKLVTLHFLVCCGFQLTLAAPVCKSLGNYGNYIPEFAVSLLYEPIKLQTLNWNYGVWFQSSIRSCEVGGMASTEVDDSNELQRWLPTFEHQLDNESSYDMHFWDFQIKPI